MVKTKQIIVPAGKYDSDFLSSIPQKIEKCHSYYALVLSHFKKVKKIFPLLRIVILPTTVSKTAFIQGLLLPLSTIKFCHLDEEQYEEYGLPIFAHIPYEFEKEGIQVFDSCNRIVWKNVPNEYKHCNPIYNTNKCCICTHHEDFITKNNCILGVLQSAYHLFVEYRKYDEIGEFNLDCLPHNYTRRR